MNPAIRSSTAALAMTVVAVMAWNAATPAHATDPRPEDPTTGAPRAPTDRTLETRNRVIALMDPPATPGAIAPALAQEGGTTVSDEHEILLTWLEPRSLRWRLRFARFRAEGWTQPITVADPVTVPPVPSRPALTVFDTQAVRRTLVVAAGDVIARSGDAGRTWSRLPAAGLPHRSFAGGEEGGYAFWLAPPDADASARLLGSRILAGETLLDTRVATTDTAAAMTWDGPIVAYRDRSVHGAHDIAVVRRESARWTSPRVVRVEGWRPPEPPRYGPAIAAFRRQVAVAWYTEAEGTGQIVVAFSHDAGHAFDAPIALATPQDDARPIGAVDVAMTEDGRALVLWTARAAEGAGTTRLDLTAINAQGRQSTTLTVARDVHDDLDGMPRLIRARDRLAITWLDGDPTRVRLAVLPVAAVATPVAQEPRTEVATSDATPRPPRHGERGDPLPALDFTTLTGDVTTFADLEGRPALINLWATWCIPCLAEMPELAAVRRRHAEDRLAVIGISFDAASDRDKVATFEPAKVVGWDVWLDPEMRLYAALRVRGLPVTLVVDRKGRIVWRHDGAIEVDDPDLIKALAEVLATP